MTEATEEKTDPMARARAAKAAKAAAKTEEETLEEKRKRLERELSELPPAPTPPGLEPGTVVGTGAAARKVPFTRKWFEDNVEMVEFIPPEDGQVKLNGVKYMWKKGKKTKIPSSHYAVWEDAQDRRELGYRMYDPPQNLVTNIPGYASPVHRMGSGLLEPIPDSEPNQ